MYQKSIWSFNPVCGCCLSSCSVFKYWFENEKQEIQKSYTSPQRHQILLWCFSLKSCGTWRTCGLVCGGMHAVTTLQSSASATLRFQSGTSMEGGSPSSCPPRAAWQFLRSFVIFPSSARYSVKFKANCKMCVQAWSNGILLRNLKYFVRRLRDLFLVFLVRHLSNSIYNTSISGVKSSWTSLYVEAWSRS